MKRISLATKHFPGEVLGKIEEAVKTAKELGASSKQCHSVADDALDELYDELDSSYIITDPAGVLLHEATEQGNQQMIMRVVTFRNEYLVWWPDDIGLVRAAIDEHLPSSMIGLLSPR